MKVVPGQPEEHPRIPGLEQRLRDARKTAGRTQESVAETLGVSWTSVSGWETGRQTPTVQKLERLAELYGVTVDSLLGSDQRANVEITDPELRQFFRGEFDEMTEDEKDLVRRAVRTARELHQAREAGT